jgi:3,4-dihydroxy 2-butanone 4-phosphate synthase/GTP cyclohydrolase II
MPISTTQEIVDELRAGRMVILVDEEDRENEGDLVLAAEHVTPEAINFMIRHARGLVCLTLSEEICDRLELPMMTTRNGTSFGTNFTVSIEAAEGVTTGISAYDRAHTIRTAVRPDASGRDLSQPGHIFPLQAQPGGVLNRAGHTEAASDLALLAGLEPAGVLVEILNPDGSMARRPELEVFEREHGLKMGSIEDLIRHRLATEHTIERVDARTIDTEHGPFRLHTYRDRLGHGLHFALLRGQAESDVPTLVRVQMQNPLADGLHWRRQDFGPAVGDVLAAIAAQGRGALVLLAEHVDAATLLARIRTEPQAAETTAHEISPGAGQGLAEWRRNGAGSQILADLGLGKLRVLGTPRKQVGLAGFGLEVVEYV